MARNLIIPMLAADDGAAALNANEPTKAYDITNMDKATIAATGTFGGGTLTVQLSNDGTNWFSSGLTIAAAGKVDLAIPAKFVRGNLAGATTPSLNVTMALRTLD